MIRKITKIRLLTAIGLCLFWSAILAQGGRHTCSAPKLGTVAKLTYYAANDLDHQSLETNFFELIDSLNLIFSDYEPLSEINGLRRQRIKQFIPVSKPLFDLIGEAIFIAKKSNGRFDITVGALTTLWRNALRNGRVPKRRQIRKARRQIGFRYIQLDSVEQQIRLKKKGMQLDFGGIAKGYIGDQLSSFLRFHGVHQYLIDLGGDLTIGDPPPGDEGWTIAVEWASKTVVLKNVSVASSGPDYQFFVHRGKRYSHIIDPQTGWGITEPFNTTVISQKGWMADAVASVGALIPPEETLQLLMTLDQVEGLMQRSGQIYQSDGFDKYVLTNSKN